MSEVDLDYVLSSNFNSSVMSDDNTSDVDHNNVSILVKQLKDIDELILKHNTFDVIVQIQGVSVESQIAAHKLLVGYLRQFRDDLAKKVEGFTYGR